jgi:hypothetical protein
MTSTLSNHLVTEERLTVTERDATQLKLLGVSSYSKAMNPSRGEVIAELTMKFMKKWNCNDSIVNMTFETTSPKYWQPNCSLYFHTRQVAACCPLIRLSSSYW